MKAVVLLLLLAACGPKLPNGAKRTDADPDHHSFRLTRDNKTLVYLRGTYPRKVYLVRRRLDEAAEIAVRRPNHRMRGPIKLSSNGKEAYVRATVLDDNGDYQDDEAVLKVDLESGELEPASAVEPFADDGEDYISDDLKLRRDGDQHVLESAGGRERWRGAKKPTSAILYDGDVYLTTTKPSQLHKSGAPSIPWTEQPSRLLGAADGKLHVAVTKGERASFWTLDLDMEKLPQYAAAMDTTKTVSTASLAMVGMLGVLLALFGAVFLDRINRGPSCKNC